MSKKQTIKVFVSSTSHDLREERNTVRDSLSRMGLGFIGMEIFGSSPMSPLEECIQKVTEADIFILIIAHRYGTITKNGMSYSESEYEAALNKRIPCFIYFKDEQTPVLPSYIEQDPFARDKLQAFKDRLKEQHVISWFSSPEDLARIAVADLHKHIVDTYLTREHVFSSSVSLSDIIPRGLLELVLEGLSQRFKIPIGIFTLENNDYFYSYPEHLNFVGYCRLLRSNSQGFEICKHADIEIAKECIMTGREASYTSHAGLTDFAFPILVGDAPVGVIFCGQIRMADSDAEIMQKHVVELAQSIGEDPAQLLEQYMRMPVHRMEDLEPLIAKIRDVISYFAKLAREKSVYATEASGSILLLPGREETYAWELLTNKELTARLLELTEEEFTLRLVVPCLERAGFANVRYCHGASEAGCDLLYEYYAPLGEVIHYGAQIKMNKIRAATGKQGSIHSIIEQGQAALTRRRYDEFSGIESVIDQFWIICPYDISEEAKRCLCDRATGHIGQTIHFLAGQTFLEKLKRFVPVLLDRLVREQNGLKMRQ